MVIFLCCSNDDPDKNKLQIMQGNNQNNQNEQGKPKKPAIIEEDADLVWVAFQNASIAMSSSRSFIITIYPDENVVFNCMVDKGTLRKRGTPSYENVKNLKAVFKDQIIFNSFEIGENGQRIEVEYANIEIVLTIEETIIGYTVIQIRDTSVQEGFAEILKSVLFPKVDGKYQNISEEYVSAAIEKIIAENKREDIL